MECGPEEARPISVSPAVTAVPSRMADFSTMPTLKPATLRKLINRHRRSGAALTLLSTVLKDASGYGRIIRDSRGNFKRIVEHADATPEEATVNEINAGIYCAQPAKLFDALEHGGAGFVLVADVPLGDATVEELVKVVGIGVHEDGLACAACREVGNGGLGLHVVERVHPDAEVREEGFGELLTEFVIDGGGTGRDAVAATITAESSEEGAVGGAGHAGLPDL